MKMYEIQVSRKKMIKFKWIDIKVMKIKDDFIIVLMMRYDHLNSFLILNQFNRECSKQLIINRHNWVESKALKCSIILSQLLLENLEYL